VLILIWWKRGRVDWQRDVKPLLPFVVLAIGAGLLTAWMERAFSGAEGEEFQLSVLDRFLIAGCAFWLYIGKLLFPNDLSLIYPRWKIDSRIWWQYLFPVAALGLFWSAWNQRKRWRWFSPRASSLLRRWRQYSDFLMSVSSVFHLWPTVLPTCRVWRSLCLLPPVQPGW
jgi:hypothetical protein